MWLKAISKYRIILWVLISWQLAGQVSFLLRKLPPKYLACRMQPRGSRLPYPPTGLRIPRWCPSVRRTCPYDRWRSRSWRRVGTGTSGFFWLWRLWVCRLLTISPYPRWRWCPGVTCSLGAVFAHLWPLCSVSRRPQLGPEYGKWSPRDRRLGRYRVRSGLVTRQLWRPRKRKWWLERDQSSRRLARRWLALKWWNPSWWWWFVLARHPNRWRGWADIRRLREYDPTRLTPMSRLGWIWRCCRWTIARPFLLRLWNILRLWVQSIRL